MTDDCPLWADVMKRGWRGWLLGFIYPGMNREFTYRLVLDVESDLYTSDTERWMSPKESFHSDSRQRSEMACQDRVRANWTLCKKQIWNSSRSPFLKGLIFKPGRSWGTNVHANVSLVPAKKDTIWSYKSQDYLTRIRVILRSARHRWWDW